MSHFNEALEHLLHSEGLYLESDSEKGGGAMRGVSLSLLQEYRNDPSLTLLDLQALTEDEAKEIYRVKFWERISGDQIVGRLTAIAMLDQAVNRGVRGYKIGLIEMIPKKLKVELVSHDYPSIVAALNQFEDKFVFIELCNEAMGHYIQLAVDKPEKFLNWQHGWKNRVFSMLRMLAK